MLDQLWSNLGPQAQGFAEGGPVPGQDISKYEDIYGKKMAELRSSREGGQPGGQPQAPPTPNHGMPPAGGAMSSPVGIASIQAPEKSLATAVKDSTESVRAGIMAASGLHRGRA